MKINLTPQLRPDPPVSEELPRGNFHGCGFSDDPEANGRLRHR